MNLGYIISSIISGLIMLSLLALNHHVSRTGGEQTMYRMADIRAELVLELIAEDFRAMGYRVESAPVVAADSHQIRFRAHFEGDEDPTEIRWQFDQGAMVSPDNPSISPLYRIVDGNQQMVSAGVTRFRLEYLDEHRQTFEPDPATYDEIRQIRLELVTESAEGYDNRHFGRSSRTTEITPLHLH
ncbi:hypothetical protein QA596_12120 [Balneolales bacterium ANBcel1]|nr:hypothetical protein [Balneolales bacterium ANBcel1]